MGLMRLMGLMGCSLPASYMGLIGGRRRVVSPPSSSIAELHQQDIIGESDCLLNGWTVAFLERDFVGHRMTE